ncbi:uncharacterized protein BT62DRAFT_273667 [Guyanagaster necrorhizus]|uniref:Uncharacterized protein n=1 Tax=Guyanagaster necrorhizus TaxID=856835 RepID=A0A9P7W4F2_9AGAR|nr:uncharacterized protein BT62DRAFT_273667 [Guyanagaster necrorhizus MCA 3950]KAG7451962.1 hypothetical protein BT62DRAFT_273667 [Guyanagaster necrorhizus MCA 3950]
MPILYRSPIPLSACIIVSTDTATSSTANTNLIVLQDLYSFLNGDMMPWRRRRMGIVLRRNGRRKKNKLCIDS